MPSLPSVTDVKTYLGLTGTGDDALIAERLATAISQAERDTGRTISAASNTTTRYSSNNEALIGIHDRPYVDGSRTVTWNGATLTEGVNCWFLPDRRDQNISTQLQIRYFNTNRSDWYKVDPMWWDKNLDNGRGYGVGQPNDIVVAGIVGMPFPKSDVNGAILVLTAFLYWRAKSGATGTAYTITGEEVALTETPPEYQAFVKDWRIHTAVSSVG
jgi:hypothetical protein